MAIPKEDKAEEKSALHDGLSGITLEKLRLLVDRKRGTSQSQISRDTGVPQSAISEILSGKQRPFADQLIAIARAADVSLDWLVDDEQAPDSTPRKWEALKAEGFLAWFVDQLGMTREHAAEAILGGSFDIRPKGLNAPRAVGKHGIAPARKLKRGEVAEEAVSGRALGEKE
ncbi:helix-turn-helix domain-containing protein [Paludisphaera soli]|uniref:helix-turn-helix domain-containing protein n=1 Tax=Paludisphaera soli TaxID=2712865 RepID=UPI0013EA54E3|nr:helix-turn-helix transcriptional regulator [Paludisphaera soli]